MSLYYIRVYDICMCRIKCLNLSFNCTSMYFDFLAATIPPQTRYRKHLLTLISILAHICYEPSVCIHIITTMNGFLLANTSRTYMQHLFDVCVKSLQLCGFELKYVCVCKCVLYESVCLHCGFVQALKQKKQATNAINPITLWHYGVSGLMPYNKLLQVKARRWISEALKGFWDVGRKH